MSNRYLIKSKTLLKSILKEVKKLDTAVEKYTKIGKIPAMPYRAFVNFADYFFLAGSIEQSENLLNNAINFVSTSTDAFINLGIIKQSKGDILKAIEYYKKALKKDSKNVKALCLWGNCLSIQNNIEEAIKKYEKAVEIDNKNADAYLCWGLAFLKQRKYNNAKEKFELSVENNTKDARSLFMLATVEIELGMYDSALERLMFIINATENNFGAYHNIAYIYFKKKEYEKTIIFARTAIKMAPMKMETYLLLGDTFSILKQFKDAIETYKDAENNNLKSFFLYSSWGSTLQKMKKYENAIEKYKQALEMSLDELNEELYAKLAQCYILLDNWEDAKINAEKAFEISPENYLVNDVLADICIHENKFDEAILKLNICSKYSETKSNTFLKLARCYNFLNKYEESNKYYEKAIEYNRENNSILIEYIKSLNKQKKYDVALNKIITLEQKSNEELEVLSLIFEVNYNIAKGNIYGYNGKKAIKVAEKIKEKYSDNFDFEDRYKELTKISRE